MDPTLFIVAAAGAALWFWNRSKTSTPVIDETPPITTPADPPNGVYPDAGMTLREAQKILIALGYNLGASGADNIYGPMTRVALLSYQKANALSQHGFVDKTTATFLKGEAMPVTKEGYRDEGYQAGYQRGYTSRGLGYDVVASCVETGAAFSNGGKECPSDFVAGYDEGFGKGAFDIGYTEGEMAGDAGAPLEAVFAYSNSSSYRKGARAGWVKTYKGEIFENNPITMGETYVSGVSAPRRAAVAARAAGR